MRRFEKRFSKPRLVGVATPTSATSGWALVATGYGRLTKEELEAARRVIRRKLKRFSPPLFRLFCTLPVTKKPLQARMGKGKGRIDHYVAQLYPGKVVVELHDLPAAKAVEALEAASFKLSVSTSVCSLSSLSG